MLICSLKSYSFIFDCQPIETKAGQRLIEYILNAKEKCVIEDEKPLCILDVTMRLQSYIPLISKKEYKEAEILIDHMEFK